MTSYGFLTDHDRAFLRGEIEYEGESAAQNRTQKQYRIRKNIQQAFRDFELLWQHKDKINYSLLFNKTDEGMHDSIAKLFSLIYFNLGTPNQAPASMEFLIEDAIRIAEDSRDTGQLVDVNVEITTNIMPEIDIGSIRQTLDESPDKLSPIEIGILAVQNELDAEDLEQIQETHKSYELPDEMLIPYERSPLMESRRDDSRYIELPWVDEENP